MLSHREISCRSERVSALRRSLTWDQGKEMHAHRRFTIATNVQVYFCEPRSPWQRGSNENTNGLLRQYFPGGTDFSRTSQRHLNAIALRLNQRPRKTLGFETPADPAHHYQSLRGEPGCPEADMFPPMVASRCLQAKRC